MLQGIFRGTGPGVIMIIVIISFFLWMSAFIEPSLSQAALYEKYPMPLYSALRFLTGGSRVAGLLLACSLLCLMMVIMVNFNTRIFFINERTFLPAALYLLFTSIIPRNQVLNPVLPASLFLMIAIYRIMDSYRKPGTAFNFFDAGVLISTGSLIYANLLWFWVLVIIGMVLLRTGDFREIFSAIAGVITPWALTLGIYYVSGWDLRQLIEYLGINLFGKAPGFSFTIPEIIILIFTGATLLTSIGFLFPQMNSKKIRSRKTFSLFLWMLLVSAAVYLIVPSASVEMMWLAAIPSAYLLSHYFIFSRRRLISEIVFLVLFLLVMVEQAIALF